MPTFSSPPGNVSFGKVVWRAGTAWADGPDGDNAPDFNAPIGTVTFTPTVALSRDVSSTPTPITILPDPVVCILDDQGYLCTPANTSLTSTAFTDSSNSLFRGVWLTATDDPDLNPGFLYTVSYKLVGWNGRAIPIDDDTVAVPSGAGVEGSGVAAVDLTTVGAVPTAPDPGVAPANAAAAAAAASAAEAAAFAGPAAAALAAAPLFLSATYNGTSWPTRASVTAPYTDHGLTFYGAVIWVDPTGTASTPADSQAGDLFEQVGT